MEKKIFERLTREQFKEFFCDFLTFGQKFDIAKLYCSYEGMDDEPFDFDDEFFEVYFSSPVEAARATYFGKISSWLDPYIRFNAYGNLETMTEAEVEEWANDLVDYIYDCEAMEDELTERYRDEIDDYFTSKLDECQPLYSC